jgi:hypothetical protein
MHVLEVNPVIVNIYPTFMKKKTYNFPFSTSTGFHVCMEALKKQPRQAQPTDGALHWRQVKLGADVSTRRKYVSMPR